MLFNHINPNQDDLMVMVLTILAIIFVVLILTN